MVRVLFIVILFGIPACATKPPVTALIPVPVTIKAHARIERPQLPVDSLTAQSTDAEVIAAYPISIELLRGYAERLELLIWPKEKLNVQR